MKPGYASEIASLSEQGRLRTLRPLPSTGGKFVWDGRDILNFSSNDYLNLASDRRVKAGAAQAVETLGCGATASRLMSGDLALHEEVERGLARLVGQESALLFGSGFLTNLGVLSALAGRRDTIFADRLNHASLVDGALLSRARVKRYGHCDIRRLASLLESADCTGRKIIVSDSVFSMDGDFAPLSGLSELAERHGALLVIDEAHAIGVFGKGGGGLCRCAQAGILPDVTIGTLGKALGGYGGFAACCGELRRLLINRARSFIYSTGLPPACLGGARAALQVLKRSPQLGATLLERAGLLRGLLREAGFDVPEGESQIIPLMVGENERALALSRAALDQGVLAVAVRPPTVPEGTARLRLSVTLAHTEADLEAAAQRLRAAARTAGAL